MAAEVDTLGVEREQAKIVFDEIDFMCGKFVRHKFKFNLDKLFLTIQVILKYDKLN